MKLIDTPEVARRIVLAARTAEDVMTPIPVPIQARLTVHAAAAALTDREINARSDRSPAR